MPRQIGEATEKTLRQMAARGARLHEMSRETGLRIFEVEEVMTRLGIEKVGPEVASVNGFQHRKIGWEIVLSGAGAQMWASYSPSNGFMTLSKGAAAALGNTTHIVVLWASEERLIGVRPATENEPGARKFRRQFSATALAQQAGLTKGRRYPATMQDGILVIDVSGAGK